VLERAGGRFDVVVGSGNTTSGEHGLRRPNASEILATFATTCAAITVVARDKNEITRFDAMAQRHSTPGRFDGQQRTI